MLAVSSRIPIPPHLGGGFVDDPGPAPLDMRSRGIRRVFRHARCREWWLATHPTTWTSHGDFAPLSHEAWRPDEIEECARFARMNRDD